MSLNSCRAKKNIFVAPFFKNCKVDSSKKCLQFKENKEDKWQLLDNSILGFEYEEGYTYKINVTVKKTDSPPTFKLVRILSKEKIENQSTLQGHWIVTKISGIDSLLKQPTLIIDLKNYKVSGNAGCNNYSTTLSVENNTVIFDLPISTKMYCTNMNVEKVFFECLKNSYSYKIEKELLLFYTKDHKLLFTCMKI
jgi:heat shock protein HslJ